MRDELFIRGDVPMTKEEVRILTLDRLALEGAQCFIDVGAGTGSVSIEAALRYSNLNVIAIEQKETGVELIQKNQEKFRVENLEIIHAKAPLELNKQADAIFVGGSGGSLKAIIDWSHEHLYQGGRLVLNFILLNNLMEALEILGQSNFVDLNVTELQVSRLTTLGSGKYFKPNNPTFIISCQKGEDDGKY